MKYLKKFNTLGSAITWDRTGNNSRVSPITYFIEESGQVLYREYVNMTPNGHDFVDLGLPSGTLWATMNIGASDPNQAGSYFAWGEIETKNSYTPETYSYHLEDYPYYTKYNDEDNKLVLDEEDDIAHVLWEGGWHIPTMDQFMELVDNRYTTLMITSNDSSITIVSKINSNYIALPFAGYKEGETVYTNEGTQGSYLSMNIKTGSGWTDISCSDGLDVYKDGTTAYSYADSYYARGYGYQVRPVLGDRNYIYSNSGFTEK